MKVVVVPFLLSLLLLGSLSQAAGGNPLEKAIHIPIPTSPTSEPLFETTITVPKAAWLRLFFSRLLLPEGTHLALTSLSDGAQQHLDGRISSLWQLSSALFNGDSLLLQVFASPHPLQLTHPGRYWRAFVEGREEEEGGLFHGKGEEGMVILKVGEVLTDLRGKGGMGSEKGDEAPEEEGKEKSICYSPDTRVFSNDTRQGRYIYGDPNGCCTAWMIDDANHCFLSAGHCSEAGKGLVEFNVPLSAEDGTLIHPPPKDQYIIDQTSMQTQYSGTADWRYFGVFSNSETALHPIEAYSGEFYKLQKSGPAPPRGTNLRITGFGENESFPSTHRRVLKTATGPFSSRDNGAISYRVDTSNGNSGSAVFDEDSGVAIGIHTLGGCRVNSQTSVNAGVDIFLASLQKALAEPKGICARNR